MEWGSDRTLPTIKPKSDSFLRLAGDPNPKDGPSAGTHCVTLLILL